MITEEEKERIKSEEIFRDEVRKTLSEKEQDSFSKKIWKFFNSPLGLWLLSTVLVGLVVYFYNDSKLKNEISATNAAAIQKLQIETSNRLQQFKLALSNQEPSKLYYQKEELAYMIDGILVKDGSLSPKKPVYIFPEYKDRTMNSLLYEIGRLTTDKEQVPNITEARTILTSIQTSILKMEDPPRFDFPLSQRIQQMAQAQPENLSPEDRKRVDEYEEKKKRFEQDELEKYNNRTKKNLDSLLMVLQSNAFLKALSEK